MVKQYFGFGIPTLEQPDELSKICVYAVPSGSLKLAIAKQKRYGIEQLFASG